MMGRSPSPSEPSIRMVGLSTSGVCMFDVVRSSIFFSLLLRDGFVDSDSGHDDDDDEKEEDGDDDEGEEVGGATAATISHPLPAHAFMKFAGKFTCSRCSASMAPEDAFAVMGDAMGAHVFVQMATASTP